jgi:hypothetical protein
MCGHVNTPNSKFLLHSTIQDFVSLRRGLKERAKSEVKKRLLYGDRMEK